MKKNTADLPMPTERDTAALTLEFVLTEVKRILDEERETTNSQGRENKLAA